MKKIFSLLFIMSAMTARSQPTIPFSLKDSIPVQIQNNTNLSKQLLLKSKRQKTTSIVLITGGSILLTTALLVTLNDISYLFDPNHPASSNSNFGSVCGYTGTGLVLAGIPFAFAAKKNSKRAQLYISKGSLREFPGIRSYQSFTAIGVKIKF